MVDGFCGMGGTSLGFALAGFKVTAQDLAAPPSRDIFESLSSCPLRLVNRSGCWLPRRLHSLLSRATATAAVRLSPPPTC